MHATKTLTLKRVGNIVLLSIFALVLALANLNFAQAELASITSFEVNPSTFNPDTESADINFSVNKTGSIVLEVFDGTTPINTIAFKENVTAGSYSYHWDGTDKNNNKVAEDTYKVQLYFYDNQTNVFAEDFVTVDYSGGQPPSPGVVITNDYAVPNPFNPNVEDTKIYFTLSQAAEVTVWVEKSGMEKTLLDRVYRSAGTWYARWDGTNSYGAQVNEGQYKYVIQVEGSFGQQRDYGYVEVDYDGGGGTSPSISNDYASPNPFDPHLVDTYIRFSLNAQANITLNIYDNQDDFVDTVIDDLTMSYGSHAKRWDGRNAYNQIVDPGTYTYKITATNPYGSDIEYGSVTVAYQGGGNGLVEPEITNSYANPEIFDPSEGESTTVHYHLNTCAYVTKKVYDASTNNLVRTLEISEYECEGNHTTVWNGRDLHGDIVPDGDYYIRLSAVNSEGTDTEDEWVDVRDEGGGGNEPDLTDVTVDTSEFNPEEGEDAEFTYTLDECAYVTVKVYDENNDNLVRTLKSNVYECAGTYTVTWDGRDNNGDIVDDGQYYFKVTATNNDGSDQETADVSVDTDGSSEGPNVYDLEVDPYRFDPDEEDTELSYRLNECADVTVKVYDDDDDLVVELRDEVNQCEGSHEVNWDGEDDNNDVVSDGEYYFAVYAANNDGSDRETIDVRVDKDGDGGEDEEPEITDVDVDPEEFDPYDDFTIIEFELNTCADVTLEVRDEDDDLVREILDDKRLCEDTHEYVWNGRDEGGDFVRQDDYEFYIRAENSEGSDTARADVEVDYNGHVVPNGDRCAGFIDVHENDPYCDAIKWVKDRGIFNGYPDAYFRPYQAINRAETTKVILVGFNYQILPADGTNLGFWDVLPEAWYMPYLRTAKHYGIIQGYPDGSFQPARVVNRVELLKIFLKTAGFEQAIIYAAFDQPYPDTPVQADTQWYLPYVRYSKSHGLMDPDYYGNFNPAKPMTRGDVAMLFYRFFSKGLNNQMYSYNNYPYGQSYNYNYNYPYNNYDSSKRPQLTDVHLSEYDLEEGDNLRIYYEVDRCADITIEILDDDDDVVRELRDEVWTCSGDYSILWDGEDEDGDPVRDGDYKVSVKAENQYGYERDEVEFQVEDGGDLRIFDLEVNPDEFDPDVENTRISFEISERADVSVRVYDEDNDLVRELWDEIEKGADDYNVYWDGEDDDNDDVPEGLYTIKVTADSGEGYDREEVEVEVTD